MGFRLFYYVKEALKPSQYRQYMKNKDYRTLYDDFFKGKHRIYFPFRADTSYQDSRVQREIVTYLKKKNWDVLDYMQGIAQESGQEEEVEIKDEQGNLRKVKKKKRIMKIGKLLATEPTLQQKFQDDPMRAGVKQVNQMIVFSRHPYDIAGMSTDRGWSSCMNLKGGCNKHYVQKDVEEGSIVAYLITANDKNINKPMARILFKPHDHVDERDEQILIPDTTYGTEVPGFKEKAKQIIDKGINIHAQDGTYTINKNLYQDHDTGVANKWGDEITSGINIHDLHKIPDNILRSAQFVQLIDQSEDGYDIYYQDWESYPEALRDNSYFEDRFKEAHREGLMQEYANDWDDWNNIPTPFKEERDFPEEWVKHNSDLLGESEWDDIPDEIKQKVNDLGAMWIESRSDYLELPWEEFQKTVLAQDEDQHDTWIEKWAEWEDNMDQYYEMNWDQIPEELKGQLGSAYWTNMQNVTQMDQVPWEDLSSYVAKDVMSHIFRVNPQEKEKALSDMESFKKIPYSIQQDMMPDFIAKKMKDVTEVGKIFNEVYPQSHPSDNLLQRTVAKFFERNPQSAEKYYNMSEDELRKQPTYISNALDGREFYARKSWDVARQYRTHYSINDKWTKDFQERWMKYHPEAKDNKPSGWIYSDNWKPNAGDKVTAWYMGSDIPLEVTSVVDRPSADGSYTFNGKYTGPDGSVGKGHSVRNGEQITMNSKWVRR
jgi:hypothetical protein